MHASIVRINFWSRKKLTFQEFRQQRTKGTESLKGFIDITSCVSKHQQETSSRVGDIFRTIIVSAATIITKSISFAAGCWRTSVFKTHSTKRCTVQHNVVSWEGFFVLKSCFRSVQNSLLGMTLCPLCNWQNDHDHSCHVHRRSFFLYAAWCMMIVSVRVSFPTSLKTVHFNQQMHTSKIQFRYFLYVFKGKADLRTEKSLLYPNCKRGELATISGLAVGSRCIWN